MKPLLIVGLFISSSMASPYTPGNWYSRNSGGLFDQLGMDFNNGMNQMSHGINRMSSSFNDYVDTMADVMDDGFQDLGQQFNQQVGNMGRHIDDMGRHFDDVSRRFEDFGEAAEEFGGLMAEGLDDMGRSIEEGAMDAVTDFRDTFTGFDMNRDFMGQVPQMPQLDIFGNFGSFQNMNNGLIGSIMRKYGRAWWTGDNVCVETEVTDGENLDNVRILGNGASVKMETCEEREGVYECQRYTRVNGEAKTIKKIYSCCRGFKLSTERKCEEFNIRPTEETMADLEGTEFLTLLSDENVLEYINNSTVFMPTDQAIDQFKKEMNDLQGFGPDRGDNVIYNVDSGLLVRKKRELGIVVDEERVVKDLLLGHFSADIKDVKDYENNEIVTTKAGTAIRMSVYNTAPVKVVLANCALITSKDHHTTTGVVHVIDKIMKPATATIGAMLSQDLQFRTFMSALGSEDIKRLNSETETLTVFAPSEKAFEKLTSAAREKVLGSGSCSNHILSNHILDHILCSGVITGTSKIVDGSGEALEARRDEEGNVFINDIKLSIKDMVASNGVIHVIDDVIIPESAKSVEEELKHRNANTFLELVKKAGLKERLNNMNNFTLLLPSNSAMNQIPSSLLEDNDQLEEILLHHVVPGNNHCLLRKKELPALSGKKHMVQNMGMSSSPTISCSRIVAPAKGICGGKVHVIDRLLLPARTTIFEALKGSPDHSHFFKLLEKSNIRDEMRGGHTVFAPTNAAFQNLHGETLHKILGDEKQAELLLRSHIIPKPVCCSYVPNYSMFSRGERTLAGHSVHLTRSYDGRVHVNRGTIDRCDMVSEDGIVHSIDTVLLPRHLQNENYRKKRILDWFGLV